MSYKLKNFEKEFSNRYLKLVHDYSINLPAAVVTHYRNADYQDFDTYFISILNSTIFRLDDYQLYDYINFSVSNVTDAMLITVGKKAFKKTFHCTPTEMATGTV